MSLRRRLLLVTAPLLVVGITALPGGSSATATDPTPQGTSHAASGGPDALSALRPGKPHGPGIPQRLRALVAAGESPEAGRVTSRRGAAGSTGRSAVRAAARAPRCLGRPATLVGTERRDRIVGTPRQDVIVARGGDDVIRGRGGDDLVCAGAGDDVVATGPGKDRLDGGAGSDWVDYRGARRARVSLTTGRGSGGERLRRIENVIGSPGPDRITGDGGPNELWGGRGDDLLDGRAGDDLLCDGRRQDRLCPGAGRDRLIGGTGDDLLAGGAGDDVVDGGPGSFDVLVMLTSPRPVTVDLTAGAASGDGDDRLAGLEGVAGSSGDDVLRGGPTLTLFAGVGGNDTLVGADGLDVLLPLADSGLVVDLGAGAVRGEGDDSVQGMDVVMGTPGADVLVGGPDGDVLWGSGGDDRVSGAAGHDWLEGGDGNDVIDGGDGNDVLLGDAGADQVAGGTGDDTLDAGADAGAADGGPDLDQCLGFSTVTSCEHVGPAPAASSATLEPATPVGPPRVRPTAPPGAAARQTTEQPGGQTTDVTPLEAPDGWLQQGNPAVGCFLTGGPRIETALPAGVLRDPVSPYGTQRVWLRPESWYPAGEMVGTGNWFFTDLEPGYQSTRVWYQYLAADNTPAAEWITTFPWADYTIQRQIRMTMYWQDVATGTYLSGKIVVPWHGTPDEDGTVWWGSLCSTEGQMIVGGTGNRGGCQPDWSDHVCAQFLAMRNLFNGGWTLLARSSREAVR